MADRNEDEEKGQIGWGTEQISPLRHFLSTLQEEFTLDDFVELQTVLKDKLTRHVRSQIDGKKNFSDQKV